MKKVLKNNLVKEIPSIEDNRHLRTLSLSVRKASEDATKAVTQVRANEEWAHLKCKDFKEWASKYLPDLSYDAIRAWAEAGLITYELTNDWELVGYYSQNSMRCFRSLDGEQRKKLWADLKRRYIAENDEDKITRKWLTATKIEEAKDKLIHTDEESAVKPTTGKLFDSDATQANNESEQVQAKNRESDSEDDVVDEDIVEDEESKHEDVVPIYKPSDITAKQQHRITRFKSLLDSFDGGGSIGRFLIEKVVEEYFSDYDNIDKVIAKTVKKHLVELKKKAIKTAVTNDERKGGVA